MALHKPRHPHTLAMQTQTSWDPIKEHWATCLKTLVPAHIDPNPASSCSLRFPDHLPLRCSWEMEEETWSRQRDHPGAPSRPEEAAFDRELTPVEWLTPSPCAWQLSQEARPHNEAASGWDPGCRDLFAPMGSRKSSRPMSSPSPKGLELSAHDYATHTLFQPENESFIAQARWVLTSNLICRSWICIWALRSNCICKWFCFQRCAYQEEFISFLKEVTMLGGGFGLLDLFPSIKLLRYTSRMNPAWERLHPKIDVILNHIIADYKAKLEGAVDAESKPPRYLKSYRQKLHFLKIDPTQLPLGIWRRKSSQLELTHPRRQLSGRRRRCCGTQGWCWRPSRRSGATSTGKPEAVVKETLRLHPPGPLMAMEAREKCKVMGCDIPSKTKIIINTWAIGRDPGYRTSPDEFRPERFLESSVDFRGNSLAYIPFGGGRGICPGISFGIANVELSLAQLLYHFDWELGDERRLPQELDTGETFGITSRRNYLLVMIAKTRVKFPCSGMAPPA